MSIESISAAGNVEVPAYLALQQSGFAVERRILENSGELWLASNSTSMFSASSPLELLGLYAMRETRGLNWKADNDQINGYLAAYYPEALDLSEKPGS